MALCRSPGICCIVDTAINTAFLIQEKIWRQDVVFFSLNGYLTKAVSLTTRPG